MTYQISYYDIRLLIWHTRYIISQRYMLYRIFCVIHKISNRVYKISSLIRMSVIILFKISYLTSEIIFFKQISYWLGLNMHIS